MWMDYHIHTLFSDGDKDLSDYICEAVKRKIDEIGFCDHIYFEETVWSMNFAQLPKYISRINALKGTARIQVKAGLEVDFVPLKMDQMMQMINEFNFDYLMGAIHFIGDWSIDAEDQIHKWRKKNVDQVYLQYFTLIQDMAKSELFDIVGHLDLIKKFNIRPKKDITDLLRETVETISKSKVCVEVNTSGLRRAPCHEVYPSEELLKMCFDEGVPVTLGSDAHSPEEIGADFDKAVNVLKKVGYFEIVRFTRRNREFVEL